MRVIRRRIAGSCVLSAALLSAGCTPGNEAVVARRTEPQVARRASKATAPAKRFPFKVVTMLEVDLDGDGIRDAVACYQQRDSFAADGNQCGIMFLKRRGEGFSIVEDRPDLADGGWGELKAYRPQGSQVPIILAAARESGSGCGLRVFLFAANPHGKIAQILPQTTVYQGRYRIRRGRDCSYPLQIWEAYPSEEANWHPHRYEVSQYRFSQRKRGYVVASRYRTVRRYPPGDIVEASVGLAGIWSKAPEKATRRRALLTLVTRKRLEVLLNERGIMLPAPNSETTTQPG